MSADNDFEVRVVRDARGNRTVIRGTPDEIIEMLKGPKGDKGDPGLTPAEIEQIVFNYMQDNPVGVPGLYTGYGPPATFNGAVVGSSYIDLDSYTYYRLGD